MNSSPVRSSVTVSVVQKSPLASSNTQISPPLLVQAGSAVSIILALAVLIRALAALIEAAQD